MRLFFFILLVFTGITTSAQTNKVTLSGTVKDARSKTILPFVNVTLLTPTDSAFVTGAITNETGLFSIAGVNSGYYL
jgi:hypothetical protein